FRELSPRAAMVMVSHAMYPALDETMPASLSSTIVRGWLRERLGYEGLIVSDDLEMGAVAPLDEDGGAAVAALSAGCDLLIYGNRDDPPRRARRAIADAARKDSDFRRRLEDAAERVERTAARWPAPSTVDAAGAADTWFAAIEGDASLRV
ncbi:MAG: glycoside hydrolase family 3 protein, partial [Planctomycetota bacterium]|nr:glycoside hydrolase family 3 protein [Planctomycetota bacterium]